LNSQISIGENSSNIPLLKSPYQTMPVMKLVKLLMNFPVIIKAPSLFYEIGENNSNIPHSQISLANPACNETCKTSCEFPCHNKSAQSVL
jgi:hypothetical protein